MNLVVFFPFIFCYVRIYNIYAERERERKREDIVNLLVFYYYFFYLSLCSYIYIYIHIDEGFQISLLFMFYDV